MKADKVRAFLSTLPPGAITLTIVRPSNTVVNTTPHVMGHMEEENWEPKKV